jgi:peptidoglycan/LPS O-acetylase OafA/YrhL
MLKTLTLQPKVFRPAITTIKENRVYALDGLRGWAALSVVCFHLLWETFGQTNPYLRNPYSAFLIDGGLAVSLFFVLSGEALSNSYFSGRGVKSVISLIIKRYPRLVIPVLASSGLTALIVSAGLNYNLLAGQLINRPDWLGSWLSFTPTVAGTLRFAFYDVFININPRDSLVPFLWTMKIELAGSILILVLLLVCNNKLYGWYIVNSVFAILIVFYLGLNNVNIGNLACFIFGLYCAKIRHDGLFERLKLMSGIWAASSMLIGMLLFIDSILHGKNSGDLRTPLISMLLVACISVNTSAQNFLEGKLSRALGKISFPLFLVQFPVVISFTSWFIVYSSSNGKFIGSVTVAFMLSLMLCFVLAILFEPVEIFTKFFCRIFYRAVTLLFYSVDRRFN